MVTSSYKFDYTQTEQLREHFNNLVIKTSKCKDTAVLPRDLYNTVLPKNLVEIALISEMSQGIIGEAQVASNYLMLISFLIGIYGTDRYVEDILILYNQIFTQADDTTKPHLTLQGETSTLEDIKVGYRCYFCLDAGCHRCSS